MKYIHNNPRCSNQILAPPLTSNPGSALAITAELGRPPISHKAWGLVVKYWLRLENETGNKPINEAYPEAKINYIHNVQHMLCLNGFRDVWLNPSHFDHRRFHKVFVAGKT